VRHFSCPLICMTVRHFSCPLICMTVRHFSCPLISQNTKCAVAICLATSDLKIILLQAVVVYGDAIPEFSWRNTGKQKETSYIRRCQAKIVTEISGFR